MTDVEESERVYRQNQNSEKSSHSVESFTGKYGGQLACQLRTRTARAAASVRKGGLMTYQAGALTTSPGTRSKWRRLRVSTEYPRDRAVAAINKSFAPIDCPITAKPLASWACVR